jgi:hypothetical protein
MQLLCATFKRLSFRNLEIRPMISFPSTKALVLITLAACAAVASPAYGQTTLEKTSLGLPGWELHQQGDLFADDPATVKVWAIYSDATVKFSIGCTFGSYINVSWQPSRPLSGGVAPTSFSVAGKTVATRQFLTRAPGSAPAEYGWAEQGGDALNLLQAIYENWTGALVISGGGVTDTIPFDEEKMGGASELVLFACGQ